MMAAAATHGDVVIQDIIPKHMESISAKLIEMGCRIEEGDDSLRVIAEGCTLRSTNVKTLPYLDFQRICSLRFQLYLHLLKVQVW